jgi:hypothetical protein
MQELQQSRYQRLTLVLLLIGTMATTIPRPARSQHVKFENFHTWSDITTISRFSDRFRYDGDYGIRGLLTDRNWTLLYVRPSVRYKARSWVLLHGGAALFYNFFNEIEDLPELRPWVGLRFLGPSPRDFVISNYFRLELRAFYLKDNRNWDTELRGRWQLQVTSPDFNIGSVEGFYALTSIEFFADLGSSFVETLGERFRYNLGIGKDVTRDLQVELDYLFHKIRLDDESGSFETDDNVVRLRLFYHIN